MSALRLTAYVLAFPALLVAVFFILWLWAIDASRAHFLVRNETGGPISNLVISGSCTERRLDVITPKSEWKTVSTYQHPGHFQLSFVCDGSSYTNIPYAGTNLFGFCGVSFIVGSNRIVRSEIRQ
jgi:hypothetical protein